MVSDDSPSEPTNVRRAALRNVLVEMNLMEEHYVEDLADLLHDFLPGSGNFRTALPLAAATVQSEDFWVREANAPEGPPPFGDALPRVLVFPDPKPAVAVPA